MSTILHALQKSKFEQTGNTTPALQNTNKTSHWKLAISCALLIIIVLLSTLIYLLLNPRSTPSKPFSDIVRLTQPSTDNHIVKALFATESLPITKPEPKKTSSALKIVSVHPKLIPVREIPQEIPEIEKPMALEDVSSDLKKRFEQALLLTEIERNKNPSDESDQEDSMDDGSDIHDMSSNFQDKVPLIRYDSHVYSSIVDERWIRINGEVIKEGGFDSTGKIQLLEIEPQRSIFRVQRQSFSLESLSDWKGY